MTNLAGQAQPLHLPPGQKATPELPVLTFGPTPHIDIKQWRLRLFGLVEGEVELTWKDFLALPQTTVHADYHCVLQWSLVGQAWEGVLFRDVMSLVKIRPEARFVMAQGYGGYSTNLALEDLMAPNVILARRHNGQELTPERGWPLRLIVPQRYAWKSPKWISGFEFMAENRPGVYEQRGYHIRGDPWKEERFWPELPMDLALTVAICGTSEKYRPLR